MNHEEEYRRMIRCIKCSGEAYWFLAGTSHKIAYCNDCVPRNNCSCTWNEDTQEHDKDDDGRQLPCLDYMCFEDGVEED